MNAYITIISTDSYLPGALVLYKSLIKVNSKYKLYVLISKGVSELSENKLISLGINTIRINESIELADDIKGQNDSGGFSQWNYTLDKLYIFDRNEFDKLVYLDSDMMVTKNIDELFNYDHISAVVAGKLMPTNRTWDKLNSGTMVIKPVQGERIKILSKLDEVIKTKKHFGDQDLLQEYYKNWASESNLHLDQKYNVFNSTVEYYVKEEGYNCNFKKPDEKTLAVIHFEGGEKPWFLSKAKRIKKIIQYIKNRKFNNLKIYIMYFKLLGSIR